MAALKHRRKSLSRAIFARHQGTIQKGVFKGMRFHGNPNVSQAAYGLKIFGLYETPIIDLLTSWCPAETLIDIGAGDGYYPVGMLKSGLVKNAICFEATETGRVEIRHNAELNGVADQIKIFGKADTGILEQFKELDINPSSTLLLCDIEGAEFEVINRELLEFLSGTRFIIELHDTLTPDKAISLRQQLLNVFPNTYHTNLIKDSPRNWSGIVELENMHDLDRALVASEGRKIIGEWLIADVS